MDLPEPKRTADIIREESVRAGLAEPFLVGIDAFDFGYDFRADGLDGSLSFEPNLGLLPHMNQSTTLARPWRKLSRTARNFRLGVWNSTLKVYDYRYVRAQSQRLRAGLLPSLHPHDLRRMGQHAPAGTRCGDPPRR